MSSSQLALDASIWFFAGQVGEAEPVRHIPLGTMPFRVGRRTDMTLSLPYRAISKEHAEIFERGGELWLRDLDSTNGTYLNGIRVVDDVIIREGDLVQFATVVFRVGKQGAGTVTNTVQEDSCDRALAMMQFERLIHENAVVPFLQPIVNVRDGYTIGYEVLGRSRLFGLMSPREMFNAASQLNMEAELSRVFRRQGVIIGASVASQGNLFVNTHPVELGDAQLTESLRDVRSLFPSQQITLEIHESAVTEPTTILRLRDVLNDLDIRLAYDDFGSGQARLVELAEVRPDYLKFDMKLIQRIDSAPASRQHFLGSLVKMVSELGVVPLAEGVETKGEHQVCRQIGFELGQGYYYGRPAPGSCFASAVLK